nr:general transcription factor 3C polypeptide 2-like isoform X2 [Physcomitrium patens]|eukprot:XP_024357729.1 general transcription factor 3C polypeptide 2-like isoform X2 [Physcomitrella patens]
MEGRGPDGGDDIDPAMRWLSEMSLQPDWLEECGFGEQTPGLCYIMEDEEGDVLGAATRPGLSLFGSEAVENPSSGSKNGAGMKSTCADVVFFVGGSVWTLDWCPRRPGWSSQVIQNEFLVVGAHPRQSPHHRLGESLHGKGLLQIWAIDLRPGKSTLVDENNGGDAMSNTPLDEGSRGGRLKGRGGKWGRGKERRATYDGFSDEEPNISASPVDTYTTLTGFNLTKGGREKARGKGRGKGRGRGKTTLKSSELEAETSDAEDVGPADNIKPGSPPETLLVYVKGRAKSKRDAASRSSHKNSLSKSPEVLPKMILGIVHEGEVTWDAKWRPVAEVDSTCESTEDLDGRASIRLGFLAAILGDGSVQVFDVPLPSIWELSGIYQLEKKEDEPPIIKINPIFHSSELQSNGHKSIPLAVEWSTWAPHDMLLVGCHDGTVAVFRVFPYPTPLEESRPLLFFTADSMTLRTIAWAPGGCGSAGQHLIATAGHSGWIRFWDLRDPYQPVYELQISRGVVTGIDWVSDPRCMLITMDDGSVRVLSLDKAATDTAVTGKHYTGTPTQGLASYYASYYAMWGVHVSRASGLVAYCGTDGNVLQFQVTSSYACGCINS